MYLRNQAVHRDLIRRADFSTIVVCMSLLKSKMNVKFYFNIYAFLIMKIRKI